MFSQHTQDFMVSPMNRCTAPPAFYFLQSSSVPITHTPSHSGPYEDLNQTATTDFFFQHSNSTSITTSSPLLHHDTSSTSSSSASSPLISSLAVHSASTSNTQDILSVSENDPFFIPVQGVLPPSKNVDGRYECQLCDRSYTHAKHLKRHMMRHTGQKPYGCTWCSSRFTRPDIRKRHVLKCKVRRKMEGLESIKIEEENPARMISLKNQKMNERKAKKLAEAKAQANASPKPASKPATKPKQQQSLPSPVRTASAQSTSSATSLLQSDFDPTILEASIKKELESSTTFYSTPAMSCDDLTQRPQEVTEQTVFFSSLPTPAFNHPTVPGYMTPTEPSPQVGMQQLKPGHQELSSAQQQRMYYFDFPATTSSPMGIYYDGAATQQHQQQPLFQPQLLTPQQYRVNQPSSQHGFFNESAACIYGESPLETFVPPMYHDQQ